MEGDLCSRSEEDVLETLKLSKLNQNDLVRPSQTIYFANDSSDQAFTLIQLNKDILEHVTKGETLVIRGNEDDSATLCTSDRTYDIKKARTSNTLLTLPKLTISAKKKSSIASDSSTSEEEQENVDEKPVLLYRKIIGWSHDYLELKRIHPQLNRVKQLLAENLYQGPAKEEENCNKRKYTLTNLLNLVQASEGELTNALFKLGSCCIDGYWRLLDFGYIVDCLGEICSVIDSESWDVSRVPLCQLCEKVNDSGELVPEFIVQHLISFYGKMTNISETGEKYFKLDEEKLCRFFAEMLLRDVGKFNLSEFLEVWEQSVPDGLKPNNKYLQGLAIIDKNAKPATIQYFSVDTLPQDTAARFDMLFQTKSKWTRDEIEPYIADLCLEGLTASALLTKFARSSIQSQSKVYSSRKTLR